MVSLAYEDLLIWWGLLAIPTFIGCYTSPAPYGKLANKNSLFIFPIPAWIGWIVTECPTLIAPVYAYIHAKPELARNPYILFFVAIFVLHYVNRTVIYPLRLSSNPAKATPMSIIIPITGFGFQVANCYLIFEYLFQKADPNFYKGWVYDARFLVGLVVFFTGFAINLQSDGILRSLKKKSTNNKSGNKYSIPRGGMFEYVSCANYFGEFFEWVGFAIVTWSIPGLLLAEWTFVNLAPRALQAHKWYKDTFKDYPKNRRAILPFLL